jgi:hypothetical protein
LEFFRTKFQFSFRNFKFVCNPGDRLRFAPLEKQDTSLLHGGKTEGKDVFYNGLTLRNQGRSLAGPDIWQAEIYCG